MATASSAIDYLAAACALSVYNIGEQTIEHSLTAAQIHERLSNDISVSFDSHYTDFAISRLAEMGLFDVIDDAYADSLILVKDQDISAYFKSRAGHKDIYDRAWAVGPEWLHTAFGHPDFWTNISRETDLERPASSAPTASGFVQFNHNEQESKEVILIVEQTAEAIRTSNEVDESTRGWVRSHLAAGLVLLRQGGKVLKDALISTVIKPLESALKVIVEEKGKDLIRMALKFLWSLFV